MNYHPEKYWSQVGHRIESRENGKNVIAGDDEPYYRYKRQRFLELLNEVSFTGKQILEIGCGPGGNLLEVLNHEPDKLVGVDISSQMVKLARNNIPNEVEVLKINGTELPFKDGEFDIVFTATVLQHNTDGEMLKNLIKELCRVSSDKVYLFERIESIIKGDELCYGRPIEYYSKVMEKNGLKLNSKKFINVRTSYYVSGAIRKVLNPKSRKEGEPLNGFSIALQNLSLPFTKLTDKIFRSNNDICRLDYEKIKRNKGRQSM